MRPSETAASPDPVVEIRDEHSGSFARIQLALGFNCFEFQASVGGEPRNVLWSSPEFAAGTARPSSGGIPILFPFAGRLRGASLDYGSKRYEFDRLDALGNAIHGFVLDRPWRVVSRGASTVTGEFQASRDDPSILSRWPSDFLIRVEYEISGTTLECRTHVENPGRSPLPFGFGLHPYFRIPLGHSGAANECQVQVPVASVWKLKDMLPTGEIFPAAGVKDLASRIRFADAKFDDVFTLRSPSSDGHRASIVDPTTKQGLDLRFDAGFPHAVVYTPPSRESICVEPYTCVPDAFAIETQGIATGLRTLPPGETFDCSFSVTAR